MPRRIDDDVIALSRVKRNLRRVDGDILSLLFRKSIEQKSKLKLPAFCLAQFFETLKFSIRQRACVMQQPANERRLAMIHMAYNDDAKTVSWEIGDRS